MASFFSVRYMSILPLYIMTVYKMSPHHIINGNILLSGILHGGKHAKSLLCILRKLSLSSMILYLD